MRTSNEDRNVMTESEWDTLLPDLDPAIRAKAYAVYVECRRVDLLLDDGGVHVGYEPHRGHRHHNVTIEFRDDNLPAKIVAGRLGFRFDGSKWVRRMTTSGKTVTDHVVAAKKEIIEALPHSAGPPV